MNVKHLANQVDSLRKDVAKLNVQIEKQTDDICKAFSGIGKLLRSHATTPMRESEFIEELNRIRHDMCNLPYSSLL